jgi:hypothetical protein
LNEQPLRELVGVDREHREADFFSQTSFYIEKRIENLHLSCYFSVTEDKNMP